MTKIVIKRQGFFHLPKFQNVLFFLVFGENVFLRSSLQDVFYKEGVLRNFEKFTGKHCARVSFFIKLQAPCNFIKKEALAQVLSCEFCETPKSNFSYKTPWWLLLLLHFLSSLLSYLFMQEKVPIKIKGKTLSSSRSQMFLKMAVLKRFAIAVKKTPIVECLFNKFAGLYACILLKRNFNTVVFFINFYEQVFCRTPHSSLFFETLCDDRTFWTSLGAKLTFFIFHVPFLCHCSMVVFTPKFLVSVSFARITTSAPALF